MAIEGILPSTEEAVLMNLGLLMDRNPIAFYELVSLCRDPKHRLFGNTAEVIRDLSLIQSDGTPHEVVRNVVSHHVTGDGLNMALV